MESMAAERGVEVQLEDAQYDVAKQLDQINNFVASGVDAIIVTVVDSSSATALSAAAEAGGVPLIYVNIEPGNVDSLPDNQAFVGSNEIESGTMGAYEACVQLRAAGKSGGATVTSFRGTLFTKPPFNGPRTCKTFSRWTCVTLSTSMAPKKACGAAIPRRTS